MARQPSKAEATAAVVQVNRAQRVLNSGGALSPGERAQVKRDVDLLAAYAGDDPQKSREIGEALIRTVLSLGAGPSARRIKPTRRHGPCRRGHRAAVVAVAHSRKNRPEGALLSQHLWGTAEVDSRRARVDDR